MKLSVIITRPPFNELFTISPAVLENIKQAMAEGGYDQSQPIILWEGENVVIDGHSRLQAAREVGLEDIPVFFKSFADEDKALAYAIHNQRNRRNLTDAEILRCIEALDSRKERGGDRKSEEFQEKSKASSEAIDQPESPNKRKKKNNEDKSSQKTASTVGTSRAKVEKARTVLEHGTEGVKEAVKAGTMSVNKAYQLTQEARQARDEGHSVFNRTNENIEWATWSWNPVTGCQHGCIYCYARDIAKRFYDPQIGFNPHFYPERLSAPQNTPVPRSASLKERLVFTVSMGDLFGEWVPREWIEAVMEEVRAAPQWTFIFLTKNPRRYLEIDFPKNAWVGATADTQERADVALEVFSKLHYGLAKVERPAVLFLSIEPMREKLDLSGAVQGGPAYFLSVVDWIIIGGQSDSSGEPERQPEWDWVETVLNQAREADCKVYFKPNLKVQPKEYPDVGLERSDDE
jgi:protein gp37